MKKHLLFLSLFLYYSATQGQLLYSGRPDNVGKINIENCTTEELAIFDLPGGDGVAAALADIALHPNGKLFALTSTGSPLHPTIVELDVKRQQFQAICSVAEPLATPSSSSLVCSKEGIFYTNQNKTIFACDSNHPEPIELITIPAGEVILGDLFFYQDELYVPTRQISNSLRKMYRLILEDNTEPLLELVATIETGSVFEGIAPLYEMDCTEKKLLHAYNITSSAYIDEFNLIDSTSTERCLELDIDERLTGLTSGDEFREHCELRLDLDEDDSSGRFIDHYIADSLCMTDFAISDKDVFIQSLNASIDSLAIFILAGVQHVGEEVLMTQVPNNLNLVSYENATRLCFKNNGAATEEDFAQAIRNTRFVVNATDVVDGERRMASLLYAAGESGDTAKSFIQVNLEEPLYAGEDAAVELCFGQASANLQEQLGEDFRLGGTWQPRLHFEGFEGFPDGFFSSIFDTSGVYSYIVQEGTCADTAEITVTVHPQPDFSLSALPDEFEVFLCEGDTLVFDATIPTGVLYLWEDEPAAPVRLITEPGFYIVSVEDEFGCMNFREFLVTALPDSSIYQETTTELCQGDMYDWEGQSFHEDTLVCQTFTALSGCDSTVCLALIFHPTYHEDVFSSIIEGEVLTFGGQEFDSTGVYDLHFFTEHGCDSTFLLHLDVISSTSTIAETSPYYVPTLITPSAKGQQNRFTIYSRTSSSATIESMLIYDILGQPVFQSKNQAVGDVSQAWDGRQNGRLLPTGVYVYHILIRTETGHVQRLTGQVVLVTK